MIGAAPDMGQSGHLAASPDRERSWNQVWNVIASSRWHGDSAPLPASSSGPAHLPPSVPNCSWRTDERSTRNGARRHDVLPARDRHVQRPGMRVLVRPSSRLAPGRPRVSGDQHLGGPSRCHTRPIGRQRQRNGAHRRCRRRTRGQPSARHVRAVAAQTSGPSTSKRRHWLRRSTRTGRTT